MTTGTPLDLPRDPSGHALIFVSTAMSALQNSERLLAMRNRRRYKETPEAEALWAGYWVLHCRANEMISDARRRGQLLFCFPGTTVLQQGGAA